MAPSPTASSVRFHPVAELSATLPSSYYFDPAVYEAEKERIFFRTWQLAGYLQDLEIPGDFITTTLLDQPLFVVRGKDGELRAFYNACMHRGHTLVEGKGRKTILTCPFHAWSYDTQGNLKAAGNAENVEGFRLEDFHLAEIRVEAFLNMVFVNLDPAAAPMSERFAQLDTEIRGYLPNIEAFKFRRRDPFPLACNWKFVFDQLECYHCPHLHPEAMESVDITQRKSWEYDWWQSHISFIDRAAMRSGRQDFMLKSSDSDTFTDNHVWYLWPNYLLLGQPGPANFSIVHAFPTGPEGVDMSIDHCFIGEPEKANVEQMDALRDIIFPQDTYAMVQQQAGIRSRGYRQGRLMVDKEHSWRSEHATHHFDKMVWEALNGANY